MLKQLLITLTAAVFLIGCQKESDTTPKTGAPPIVPSKICAVIRTDGLNGAFITYEYDTNNRIKSTHHHIPATEGQPASKSTYTFYRDNNNRVTKIIGGKESAFESKLSEEFEYDAKGRWIKTTSSYIPASSSHSTMVPVYNAQGFIIKITQTLYNGPNTYERVRTYEYKGGNLFSLQEKGIDNVITGHYDYYLDMKSSLSEQDSLSSYGFGLGTPSKNMLKSIKTINHSDLIETTFSYVFSGQGYVLKQTMKIVVNGNTIGNSEGVNTYKCD